MSTRNRNVRITYPDSTDGILEMDVIQGMEVCLNLPFSELRYYLKDGKVKIQQNVFALPGYRKFIRSKVARIYPRDGEFPNNDVSSNDSKTLNVVMKWVPGKDDESLDNEE